MPEIKSFPNNQDVYVGAEWVMKWLHGRTSGVFGANNNAAVSAVQDSMSVSVSDGLGWLSNAESDGIVWWNDSKKRTGNDLVLNVDVADGVLNRIDRVVVSWETTNYVALPTITILKGIPSSRATAPALTNDGTLRQISLAKISVPAGTIKLTASLITDERLDENVCGVVTENIVVDTKMANAQFNELLRRIENNLEQILADQIPDGSIFRAKLAEDALYSPAIVTGSRNFAASDIGGTVQNPWNTSATYTLTQEFSKTLPTGATIAVLRVGSWTTTFSVIIAASGIRLGIVDDKYYTGNVSVEVQGFLQTVALRKVANDNTNGDLWVAIGNVEVVE